MNGNMIQYEPQFDRSNARTIIESLSGQSDLNVPMNALFNEGNLEALRSNN